MITDKNKATEIALENVVEYHTIDDNGTEHLTHCYQECKKSALEMAKYKNKQIKEAIESLIAEIDCKTQQNMPTSTKTIYIAAQCFVKETMDTLRQKLGIN